MLNFLYNIIIFPLVQIIEIAFIIVYRIFHDRVLAIVGVSAAVTLCTMPLYFIAEKWQQAERDIQQKFKPKVDKIKSVFRGDEQYMILTAYYRQNHYHPAYAMRNSFGILIQIPFFLAAYSWLSSLEFIKGASFMFIRDLGAPDRFLSIGGFYINILPVLMTLINCLSGVVYTRGRTVWEKVQIYGMALVFLILLYNSPSGLVLYWTMNNIFSLLKNILAKTKHRLKIVYAFLCLCVIFIDAFLITKGFSPKRLFAAGLCSLILFSPLVIKLFRICQAKISMLIKPEQSSLLEDRTYIFSALILCVLAGLVIPGSLIASSVQEFSFLDSYTTPLPFIYTVFVQAMGIFLFWPLCVYFLFPKKVKHGLTLILSLLCVAALVNTFLFPGDYGDITTTFKFSNPDTFESKYKIIFLSSLATLAILAGCTYLLFSKRTVFFHSFQIIILISLTLFGIINIYKISRDFSAYKTLLSESGTGKAGVNEPEPVFHLTEKGKNVVVVMLDAAISGYIPYIFREKPELFQAFSGFTYYPNCVSLGGHTRTGAPPLFGGYEYEPRYIQRSRSYTMTKHNEALLMMPRIFQEENYRVTVSDPVLANYSLTPDLSVFAPYPGIHALNTQGKYTGNWLRSHPELNVVSVPEILRELLIRFSLLKTAPPMFRVFIYDKGEWLKTEGSLNGNHISLDTLDRYSTLDYLPFLTSITEDEQNTYTSLTNDLTHNAALFQYPDYTPSMDITNTGEGPFATDSDYHINMVGILLMGKWLEFMQKQGVYDNTRIIIASDHGRNVISDYQGNDVLPNGHHLARYHSLLLVKDFNAHGELLVDAAFMTQGDVPAIAMEGLIDNPKNPFSDTPVKADKDNGVFITTSSALQYKIEDDQWLHVHNDIFNPENWENVKNE